MNLWKHSNVKINQYKLAVVIFSLIISSGLIYAECSDDHNAFIIAHEQRAKKSTWLLQSNGGFILRYPSSEKEREKLTSQSLMVTMKNGKLFFNNKKVLADHIVIEAPDGDVMFQGQHYADSLEIIREKKRVVLKHAHNDKSMVHSTLANNIDVSHTQTQDKIENKKQDDKSLGRAAKDFTVRVLLDETPDLSSESWKLSSKKGFIIMNPLEPSKKQKIEAHTLVIKTNQDGIISINGKAMYTLQTYITPVDNIVTFNDKHYRGSIWLLAEGTSNKLINCIGIEDYVATVLSTESWPGWSLEVNKVLAIACRTYVIAMVQNAKNMKRHYHVKNTNKHQTYGGGKVVDIHQQAVEQTKGLFLTYQGQPITAMFDACCGGVITKHMQGVDFNKAPYLARSYPCTYCKDFKVFSWVAEYEVAELEEIIKKEIKGLRKIRDIKISKKDKAGVVQQVSFRANHWNPLHGKKIYSLLNKKVKSFHYSVEKSGSTITFKGRGYGHHLGLCQWGAKEMIRQGHDHKAVLEFYYPDTQLMRLS